MREEDIGVVNAPPLAREAAMAVHRGGAGCERRRDKDGEEEASDKIFLGAGVSRVRHSSVQTS